MDWYCVKAEGLRIVENLLEWTEKNWDSSAIVYAYRQTPGNFI